MIRNSCVDNLDSGELCKMSPERIIAIIAQSVCTMCCGLAESSVNLYAQPAVDLVDIRRDVFSSVSKFWIKNWINTEVEESKLD